MTVVVEHSINAIMQQLKPLVEKLSDEDKKYLQKAIGLQEQNETTLESAVNVASNGWAVVDSDPASPVDGQAWVNSTDGKARIRIGGVTVDLN